MKAFIYLSSGNRHPDLEVILSHAQALADEGYEIIFMMADDPRNACLYNIFGSKSLHLLSHKRIELGLRFFQGPYQVLSNTQVAYDHQDYDFNSVPELKAFKYEQADVGYAALSSYISATRQVLIDFNPKTKKILNRLLNTGIQNYLAFKQICQTHQFDRAVIYNGRFNDSRPILRLCQQYQIETDVIDYSCVESRVFLHKNKLTQDIQSNIKIMDKLQESLSQDELEEIACDFFYKRRHGIATNEPSYTLQQKNDLLPEGWDPDCKNIVIFSSSEDEFCAISPEWEQGLFASQLDGLIYLSELAKRETGFKFYLRLHPNLKTGQKTYLETIYQLEHAHFIVIQADSPISSYTLMLQAWQVLSFGSTMGLEATYWGKPSILLGMDLHISSNCCYVPQTYNEIDALIHRDLEPKPKENTYKFPVRMLKAGQPIKYFKMNSKGKGLFNGHAIQLPWIWKLIKEYARAVKKNQLKNLEY